MPMKAVVVNRSRRVRADADVESDWAGWIELFMVNP